MLSSMYAHVVTSHRRVCMVDDYAEYVCENETFRSIVFACFHEAQVETFDQKKNWKSRGTVRFRGWKFSYSQSARDLILYRDCKISVAK